MRINDDLISRAAAIGCLGNSPEQMCMPWSEVERILRELPAVDAAPVVHARWVKMTGMMPPEYHGHYECPMAHEVIEEQLDERRRNVLLPRLRREDEGGLRMGEIMMMPCFKCPHGFVETFTECETMNRPECEECKRPGREAAERYLMRLYMEKYGVPNVVRCRECKHAQMTYDGECKYCDFWNEDGGEALYLDGDFYCAAGERKEDE